MFLPLNHQISPGKNDAEALSKYSWRNGGLKLYEISTHPPSSLPSPPPSPLPPTPMSLKEHPNTKQQPLSRTIFNDNVILLPSLLVSTSIITLANIIFTLLIMQHVTHYAIINSIHTFIHIYLHTYVYLYLCLQLYILYTCIYFIYTCILVPFRDSSKHVCIITLYYYITIILQIIYSILFSILICQYTFMHFMKHNQHMFYFFKDFSRCAKITLN